MSDISIERTVDIELLARLHLETVTVAYKGFFPPTSLPPTTTDLSERWRRRLSDPPTRAFVAWANGRPVGAVAIGIDPDFRGEGQLMGLHVLPSEWGRGIGSALHDAALNEMVARSFTTAGLWVIADNERARKMYESRGWALRPGLELRDLGITEVRYKREFADLLGCCPQDKPVRT
jgi:ribosomal protein S18 acetylase RimI-like enzyme